jgi:hypothetical protein
VGHGAAIAKSGYPVLMRLDAMKAAIKDEEQPARK